MNRSIFKYALSTQPVDAITLRRGAAILCVGTQDGAPHLWAIVDPAEPQEDRTIYSAPTGAGSASSVPPDAAYIGTAHGVAGWMVFHYFVAPKGASRD